MDWRDNLGGLIRAVEILGWAPFLSTPIENYRGIHARNDLSQSEAHGWHGRLSAEMLMAERKFKEKGNVR